MPETAVRDVTVGHTVVRLVRDDITMLDVDAFVFYAQHDLTLGAGFGNAIAVRGGASIQKELAELGRVETGAVVVTGAGELAAARILHAVGPRFQEADIEGKLRTTMDACLDRARELRIERLAFPLMGAGYYGIPPEVSARVMVDALRAHLDSETSLRDVTICVLDTRQHAAVQAALAAVREGQQ